MSGNDNVKYLNFEDKDFSELRDMMYGLYDEDPEGLALDDAKIAKTVQECAARPEKLRIIMICVDGVVAGYSLLVFFWSNEYGGNILCVDELYVRKEYRNKGLASGFLKYLKSAYENAAAIAVETTPSNYEAEKIYARLGFKPSPNNHLVLNLPDRQMV